MRVKKSITPVTTDLNGHVPPDVVLDPQTNYLICKEETSLVLKAMENREAIVNWIDQCVLGDLRTLCVGIRATEGSQQSLSPRRLGGGNFLLAAGCCMALEYFGQVYGKGSDSTSRAKKYVQDFLKTIDMRYVQVFGMLWRSFRNGIVHGSWPQGVCIQGQREDWLAVGANNSATGDHLGPASDYQGYSFVISSVRFFSDLERSFFESFRNWILNCSDDGVLERAAPQLLEIRPNNQAGAKEFEKAKSWNREGVA